MFALTIRRQKESQSSRFPGDPRAVAEQHGCPPAEPESRGGEEM